MADIALGVVAMNRTEKLKRLLESADQKVISRVYIADAGEDTTEKTALYEKDYSFDTTVIDLEYGVELGYSRDRIVDEFDEEYLLVADSDHILPDNVMVLADQLSARPDIGGIAGSIIEPNRGRMWQSAKDFYIEGDTLVRDAKHEEKEIEYISGSPFVEFNFIPNAGLFRRECIADYSWDPKYTNTRAHADFYVGHWLNTDWNFGISPEVLFQHYPGGDSTYVSHRHGTERKEFAEEYFLDKWGYDDFRMGDPYWYDTHRDNDTLFERARRLYQEEGLKSLLDKGVEKGSRVARRNVLR